MVSSQSETLNMSENGDISVTVFTDVDGVEAEAHYRIPKGDPAWHECLQRYPTLKPGGDWITIHRRLEDGKWIDEPAPPPAIWREQDL